jgi:hypothetical protein
MSAAAELMNDTDDFIPLEIGAHHDFDRLGQACARNATRWISLQGTAKPEFKLRTERASPPLVVREYLKISPCVSRKDPNFILGRYAELQVVSPQY